VKSRQKKKNHKTSYQEGKKKLKTKGKIQRHDKAGMNEGRDKREME